MFRIFDTLFFTIERIRQHLLLVFWVLLGISVATTLALSLPLYVDSVYSGILQSRLDNPPFAFRFRYLGVWNGNIGPDEVERATQAIQGTFADDIAMPVHQSVRYISGGMWATRAEFGNLGTLGIAALEGADRQMTIVRGEWPPPPDALQTLQDDIQNGAQDAYIPVLAPESMMFRMGLQVGDTFMGQRMGAQPAQFEIVAMWRPTNENDPAWIFTPKFFDNVLLIPSDVLWQLLDGMEKPIDEVAWFLNFDGTALRTAEIDALLANIVQGQRSIEDTLDGIRVNLSPEDGLRAFNQEVDQLTQQLFIIILPVGGMVLYFVSLVAGLLVNRQRTEDVKLRSRGMSRAGIMTIHLLMWLLIVGTALAVGVVASRPVVQLIGRTASFLNFEGISSVQEVVLTNEALAIGAATGFIAASSGLLLAWRITLQNINSAARVTTQKSRAWWQRAYLDIMLLVPAGYVLYTLNQEQGINTNVETPFADPLTFVGPTLFALGATLLFLRLLPVLFGFVAGLLTFTRSTAMLMAFRELTRSMGRYRGALLMMAFTLSLTGFTASMASTLDRSLVDSINYRVGAHNVIVMAADAQTEAEVDAETGEQTLTVIGYNAPPVQELYDVDGVQYLSRVGRYDARLLVRGQRVDGTALGIDRAGLAATTFWREDYSDAHIAELLNRLAGNRTGVLLNREVAEANGIVLGQEISYQVYALGAWQNEIRARVMGFLDYFPTLDPADGFFLLTNIDPIFEYVGTPLPYDVWLTLDANAERDAVLQAVRDIQFPVLRWVDPLTELQQAQAEPARRGVLGFLSVGFVASIVLTLIGSVIQSSASFKAQSSQLGLLRAMGMGGWAVGIYVILLQGMIALSGILSGTSIGAATTLLFLPLLDFSGGLPPYLVRVAWDDIITVYAVFAGVLFFVTLFISLLFSRQQAATIVKLGDA